MFEAMLPIDLSGLLKVHFGPFCNDPRPSQLTQPGVAAVTVPEAATVIIKKKKKKKKPQKKKI